MSSAVALVSMVGGHTSVARAATGTYDVTAYGAIGDGVTDATAAVASAVADAQGHGGGTVYFPTGVYAFTRNFSSYAASVTIKGSAPITLAGAGRDVTKLVEHVANQSLLSVRVDGTVVQDLTLDTQTFNGKVAISVQANGTELQRSAVLGGSNQFALYYAGPPRASPTSPTYNTGNRVLDTNIKDLFSDDGFSFSFQQNALIQNISHTGSRLALYVDDNVTVDGYSYTPGPQTGAATGFWVTPPSNAITIKNFSTSGAGGVIGRANPMMSTNISIINEQFRSSSGFHLEVANVDGLTISGSSFNQSNTLRFNPGTSARNVSVQGSNVPAIRFDQPKSASVQLSFADCAFPALLLGGSPAPTFQNSQGGLTTVSVIGGAWGNRAGRFFKGTHTTFSVSNLAGYP